MIVAINKLGMPLEWLTDIAIDSMAACLYGEASDLTWKQAKAALEDPLNCGTKTLYRRMAVRALEHFEYLPGGACYLLAPQEKPAKPTLFFWLGAGAREVAA
jgi:hypothetical protein